MGSDHLAPFIGNGLPRDPARETDRLMFVLVDTWSASNSPHRKSSRWPPSGEWTFKTEPIGRPLADDDKAPGDTFVRCTRCRHVNPAPGSDFGKMYWTAMVLCQTLYVQD